jgi:hypothetical protein
MKCSRRFILSESWSIFEVRIDVNQLGQTTAWATARAEAASRRFRIAPAGRLQSRRYAAKNLTAPRP